MASPKVKPHSNDLHFSHEHPLEYTITPSRLNKSCFGCKGKIFPGHDFYECKDCTFLLHQVCHDMPKDVEHPSDPNHHFTLLSMPQSADEAFECKACGHSISGFYYSCVKCKDYYHILCFMAPLSVKISSHVHSVKLEFSPPYDFECDLCKRASYSGWLYRCGSCEFDAHINCAIKSKGEEWIRQGSISRNKGHKLMELIAQGMNGLDHLQLQAQPGQLSPSYQFSDALFSIDFAKSLLRDECINTQESKDGSSKKINEYHSSRTSREPTPKSEIMITTPKASGRDIWSEIGRVSGKIEANGPGKGKDSIEKKKQDANCGDSSCWSSFSFCLCCGRN